MTATRPPVLDPAVLAALTEAGKRSKRARLDLGSVLFAQIAAVGLPLPAREHKFAKEATGRLWRFDLCWPSVRLAVECDGSTFTAGRHTRGMGYRGDCEKLNTAVDLGWQVLHFDTTMIRDGSALAFLERLLGRLYGERERA